MLKSCSCFHTMPEGDYIFMPSGELSYWTCVNRKELNGILLSSFLLLLDVNIDDDCHFCRIIRYNDSIKTFFVYCAYDSMRIRITISHNLINY